MTPSIDQTLHQFAKLLPNWTLLPILTLLPNFGGFHRTLQRVRLANRGRLLLRTPGPVPFGTCICSYVETILSWTCHVYDLLSFEHPSVLLFCFIFPFISFSVLEMCSWNLNAFPFDLHGNCGNVEPETLLTTIVRCCFTPTDCPKSIRNCL